MQLETFSRINFLRFKSCRVENVLSNVVRMTPPYKGKVTQIFVAPMRAVIEIWFETVNRIEEKNVPHTLVDLVEFNQKITSVNIPTISRPVVGV